MNEFPEWYQCRLCRSSLGHEPMNLATATQHAKNRNWPMAAVEAAPTSLFVRLYRRETGHRLFRPRETSEEWTLVADGREWLLPRPQDALRITHIGQNPKLRVLQKYTYRDRVNPREGDRIVDVGAFIGEYSSQVSLLQPASVTAIEPDPIAARCCRRNTPDSVDVVSWAAHDTNGFGTLYRPSDPSDSGVFSPDADHYALMRSRAVMEYETKLRRLDRQFDHIDLLKVDAEGAEPEVLAGLGELRPDRIAVDVSAERDGEPTAELCHDWLTKRGYITATEDDVLFGWLQ